MGVGVGGCQVEAADFMCATSTGIAALCFPRPAAAWGPSCSEQGGVWERVRGRNGGPKKREQLLG